MLSPGEILVEPAPMVGVGVTEGVRVGVGGLVGEDGIGVRVTVVVGESLVVVVAVVIATVVTVTVGGERCGAGRRHSAGSQGESQSKKDNRVDQGFNTHLGKLPHATLIAVRLTTKR